MGREISFFTDYSQNENRITNYVGLMFKILYEDRPESFQNVINSLLKSDFQIETTPVFEQQRKQKNGIPDLFISQKSYNIFVETKLSDWFYSEQIERHINSLAQKNSDRNILFLLSNFESNDYESRFKDDMEKAEKDNVILQAISFDELLSTLVEEKENMNPTYASLLDEFGNYLEKGGLLVNWTSTLDVVNSGKLYDEILNGMYVCPNIAGSYNHKRAKFLGAYKNKSVSLIAEIRAIVVVHQGGKTGEIKWINNDESAASLIEEAKRKLAQSPYPARIQESNERDLQVFLLGNPKITDFIKETKGGMLGSKQYFQLPKEVRSVEEAALYLNGRNWSDLKNK